MPLYRSNDLIAGLPTIAPVSYWNFARDKSLTPVGQPATITFTRTAAADRVNQLGSTESVLANLPRFTHDPTTKECLGLLMENGDLAKITDVSGIYNSTESTHVIEFTLNSIAADSYPIYLSDGTTSNRVSIYVAATTGANSVVVGSGGVTQAGLVNTALVTSTRYRYAIRLKLDNFAVSVNGRTPITDTSGLMPVGINKINLGSNAADIAPISGIIHSYDIYSAALTDSELVALSSQTRQTGRRPNKLRVNGF